MSGPIPAFAVACAVAGLLFLWLSLRLRRRQRLLADLPTSKARGVFIGLVELKGTAESAEPLQSYLAGTKCVHYRYDIQEHWSRTVTETHTDSNGKTQTRTRHESGWTSVAEDGATNDFYVQDDTGAVLIRPAGAKLEPLVVFDETVSRGHSLYYGKGPSTSVSDSDHRRRFVEHAIPLHAPVYVVGQARERRDLVAPEIARDASAPLFLISTRSEQNVQTSQAGSSWALWFLGLVAALAVAVIMQGGFQPDAVPLLLASAAAYLGLWALGWVWMVFNSLIVLRGRVRQAWSLIDVQLKRRHDLISNLVTALSALSAHEQSVQTTVAALRAQLAATPPGQPGPDFAGLAGGIRAVAEKYPALVAQEGFSQLHTTLVETEQRIALARSYYNDIATHFATRLECVPDRWVAAIVRMAPEPLLLAEGFERARVGVNFDRAR